MGHANQSPLPAALVRSRNKTPSRVFSVVAVLLRLAGRGDERRTENRNRCGARALDCGFDLDALAAQMSALHLAEEEKGRQTLTASVARFTAAELYFEQTCAKEWHHCPLSQIALAAPAPVPQRHLAIACWPSAQAAIMGLCAWVA